MSLAGVGYPSPRNQCWPQGPCKVGFRGGVAGGHGLGAAAVTVATVTRRPTLHGVVLPKTIPRPSPRQRLLPFRLRLPLARQLLRLGLPKESTITEWSMT